MEAMKRKIFSLLTAFMTAVVIFQLSGCSSLIRNQASVKEDSSKKKQDMLSPSKLEKIKRGTSVVVFLKSGVQMSGKFSGLARVPTEEYAEIYAKSREKIKDIIMLPALNESISVRDKHGKQYMCEFLGFDYGYMILRQIEKTKPFRENMRVIQNIEDSHGNIAETEEVRILISEGKIPLISSGIILEGKAGKTQIAWKDMSQIQFKKKGIPILTIVIFGAAIYVFVYSINKFFEEIGETWENLEESCSFGAAFCGSHLYYYVDTVRDFRDKYVMPYKLGRKLVDLYYKHSPFAANLIAKHKGLKITARLILLPLIIFSYSMLHFGPMTAVVMLVLIFALPIFITSFFRRKLRRLEIQNTIGEKSLQHKKRKDSYHSSSLQ